MSDVLKGMATAEARALVAASTVLDASEDGVNECWAVIPMDAEKWRAEKLLALAALGARVVGGEFVTPLESFSYAHDYDGIVQTYVADNRRNRVLVLPESE